MFRENVVDLTNQKLVILTRPFSLGHVFSTTVWRWILWWPSMEKYRRHRVCLVFFSPLNISVFGLQIVTVIYFYEMILAHKFVPRYCLLWYTSSCIAQLFSCYFFAVYVQYFCGSRKKKLNLLFSVLLIVQPHV